MLADILEDYEVATGFMSNELDRLAKTTLARRSSQKAYKTQKEREELAVLYGNATVAQKLLDELLASFAKYVASHSTVLDASTTIKPADRQTKHTNVTISSIEKSRQYGYILFSKIQRPFFPAYKVPFTLETDIGEIRTNVTGANQVEQMEPATAGTRLQSNLKRWWAAHDELNDGTQLRFTKLADDRYRLEVVRSGWPVKQTKVPKHETFMLARPKEA